jgi:hypothetical protein
MTKTNGIVTEVDPGYWGWLQLYSGGQHWILQPERSTFTILDLAHGCALENRFAGQTEEPYSVAQHCVLVSRLLEHELKRPDLAFEGLMHDAAEGLIKDLPRDEKLALPEYKTRLEEPLEHVIAKKWHLVFPFQPEVKVADNIALMTERRDLFRYRHPDWKQHVAPLPERITPLPWREAEEAFLKRFYILWRQRQQWISLGEKELP